MISFMIYTYCFFFFFFSSCISFFPQLIRSPLSLVRKQQNTPNSKTKWKNKTFTQIHEKFAIGSLCMCKIRRKKNSNLANWNKMRCGPIKKNRQPTALYWKFSTKSPFEIRNSKIETNINNVRSPQMLSASFCQFFLSLLCQISIPPSLSLHISHVFLAHSLLLPVSDPLSLFFYFYSPKLLCPNQTRISKSIQSNQKQNTHE